MSEQFSRPRLDSAPLGGPPMHRPLRYPTTVLWLGGWGGQTGSGFSLRLESARQPQLVSSESDVGAPERLNACNDRPVELDSRYSEFGVRAETGRRWIKILTRMRQALLKRTGLGADGERGQIIISKTRWSLDNRRGVPRRPLPPPSAACSPRRPSSKWVTCAVGWSVITDGEKNARSQSLLSPPTSPSPRRTKWHPSAPSTRSPSRLTASA